MDIPFATRCSLAKLEDSGNGYPTWKTVSHDCSLVVAKDALQVDGVKLLFKHFRKAILATSPKSPKTHVLVVDTKRDSYQIGITGAEWNAELPFSCVRVEGIDWESAIKGADHDKPFSRFTMWMIFALFVFLSGFAAYRVFVDGLVLSSKGLAYSFTLPYMAALVANHLFVKSESKRKRIERGLLIGVGLMAGYFLFR